MSNNYQVLICSLCENPYGFNFSTKLQVKTYCYECGHAILLIKAKFSTVNWELIPDTTLEQSRLNHLHESAVMHYLNKIKGTTDNEQ